MGVPSRPDEVASSGRFSWGTAGGTVPDTEDAMATIKERRKALGLGRKQLSAYAYVDPRTAQLIEMGMNSDADCIERLEKTLDALEAGQEPPDWKEAVDARIAAEGHHRFSAETQSQSGSGAGDPGEPAGEA